ncbi:flavoprotein [Streptomyces sp. NPDC087787]|uniref:flavoprotein n=1 Tax=Streptomyces sp. NPDC087787 TaxID=3365803 RepID=UPI0038135343
MSEQAQQSSEAPPAKNAGTAPGKPFLYVVVCAAGIAEGVSKLITAAQERGWEVGVIATPVAMGGFFDTAAVEAQTRRPVRSAWRTPGDPRPFPPPDAVAVAPATFNTLNKWAAGIADTLALATLCETYGLGVPVAVLPCVSDTLAAHPAYRDSLVRLRGMGVRFGEPFSGEPAPGGGRPEFGWERVLDLLDTSVTRTPAGSPGP